MYYTEGEIEFAFDEAVRLVVGHTADLAEDKCPQRDPECACLSFEDYALGVISELYPDVVPNDDYHSRDRISDALGNARKEQVAMLEKAILAARALKRQGFPVNVETDEGKAARLMEMTDETLRDFNVVVLATLENIEEVKKRRGWKNCFPIDTD